MKNKLKYLIALALATALTLSLGISASAAEEETYEVTVQASAPKDGGAGENLFAKLYAELTEYATEILAALTLAGSLTLAVAYKKGLLPLVEKSLLSIGNAITKIKESTKESLDTSTKMSATIDDRLAASSEALEALIKGVDDLGRAISESNHNDESTKCAIAELRLVVRAQIDMLYDVFMHSALPQYQKDAVGERIAKMKEAMGENDGAR